MVQIAFVFKIEFFVEKFESFLDESDLFWSSKWNLVESRGIRLESLQLSSEVRHGWRNYLQMQILQLGRSLQSESEDTLESETWSGK